MLPASERSGDYLLCSLPPEALRIIKWKPNQGGGWGWKLRQPVENELWPNLYHVLNLLVFPRLGLHPEIDCCVLIYSLRGCSESYLTTGLIGVYYCQPTVAIRTARRSGWVDGGGSSPALPNPALTQSKHLKGEHWIRCRGDSPGFCLSERFLLV